MNELGIVSGYMIGLITGIFFILIFWAIGTASVPVSTAYSKMFCDYIR